jgi:hypothetical protein
MHFVYPQSILTPSIPDEMFQEEVDALSHAGHSVSLINSERLETGIAKIRPEPMPGATVAYRGWMLNPNDYSNLADSIIAGGGRPLTTLDEYLSTHYLPNWYHLIADLTPETVVLPLDSDWERSLTELGWPRFFVKDYVKSLKTSVGSFIDRPEQIKTVVSEMEKYRGTIEGGLCVRRVEEFLPNTERRYFVIDRRVYGNDLNIAIPGIVSDCARRIHAKFFSVDVIQRTDGRLRIVEVGDGQVSDLVGWSVQRFVEIFQ